MSKPQSSLFHKYETAIAHDRLSGYRHASTDTTADLISCYLWNSTLCEALYPSLQTLEVTLRNAIHTAATTALGSDHWFAPDGGVLQGREAASVSHAKEELQRSNKDSNAPGRVIAELHFGFWVSLFNAPYEQTLVHQTIKDVFPHLPNHDRTRRYVLGRLQGIRRLRNRVFHHEPIWNRPQLARSHSEIREAIGWMSPAALEITTLIDRFDAEYEKGPTAYQSSLEELSDRWQPT